MSPHDVLLSRLLQKFVVRCVARYRDPSEKLQDDDTYLHVFVPDLHIVSKSVRPQYQYGFDWENELSELTSALLDVRATLKTEGYWLRTTQLGDFLDLWRQSANEPSGVNPILADYPDLTDRFLRNAKDAVGPYLLLGNHDLEVRQHPSFSNARASHYLDGWDGALMTTHGDQFDFWELTIPDAVAAIVLKSVFGRSAPPSEYPLSLLRKVRDQFTPKDQSQRIQGDASIARTQASDGALPDSLNVIDVGAISQREAAHSLLPNAVKTVERLRAPQDNGGAAIAPNLKVVVIGHSHHARLILDRPSDIILMDCGAWIESFTEPNNAAKQPNRQIGAICGSDLRIYQLDPA